MEQRNWDDFRHLDFMENTKLGLKYYQDYLQPSLCVWVHFTHTDAPALRETYEQVLDLVGGRFQYNNYSGHASRMRNRDKALAKFPELLENPREKFIWRTYADQDGPGEWPKGKKPGVTGGAGQAGFEVWLHKFSPEGYEKKLKAMMWPQGEWAYVPQQVAVSCVTIRMPVDTFAAGHDFLQWVLGLPLLQSPALFTATAGYQMELYEGYVKKAAGEKLGEILAEHPGFETAKLGNVLGYWYSVKQGRRLPQVARVNWLSAVGEDAGAFYPGGLAGLRAGAAREPQLVAHPLAHGTLVQAGEEPGIGDGGRAPEAYYGSARLLEPFLLRTFKNEAAGRPEWLYHFHTGAAREYVEMDFPFTPPPDESDEIYGAK